MYLFSEFARIRHFGRFTFASLNVLLSCGLLSTTFVVSAEPLTLTHAQQLATNRSHQLVADDAAMQAARDMAVAASQNPDPVLRLGIENLPISGQEGFTIGRDFMTMRRVGVMQEFTRESKRNLRGERYEREADKTIAQKTETLATLRRDTALAWLDRYYAEAMANLLADQIKQIQLEINAADSAYRTGKGSQSDVFTIRSEKVEMEDRASTLNLKVRNAKTALARWVGEAAELPLADKPSTDEVPLHPHTLESQLASHPGVDVLSKQEALAATEAQLAEANKQADWSVEVAYSQRGSQYADMVSFGVSIPLQWDQKNRQDKELSAKLAIVNQAHAERDEMLRAHVAEIRTMLNEWENTRERQSRISQQLLPLTQQRTQATMSAYRGGKSTLNEVLGARRNELEIGLRALELDAEAARLWAQLSFMIPANQDSTELAQNPTTATYAASQDTQ